MTIVHKSRSGPFPDTESVSTLFFNLQASRMVRNKSVAYKQLSQWYSVITAQTD